MDSQFNAPIDKANINVPSLKHLVCPHCKSNDLYPLGLKDARSNAFGAAFLFGAVGAAMAAEEIAQEGYMPMEYMCASCRKKFEAYPFRAMPDEILDAPCTVNFKKLRSFWGMGARYHVWLNGIRVGYIRNKDEFSFPAYIKHNVVVVTSEVGIAIKKPYVFEAESGGSLEIKFKTKFLTEK